MSRIIIGSIPIDNLTMAAALDRAGEFLASDSGHLITTVNPEMVLDAQTDPLFMNTLSRADLSLPDGTGLWFAGWFLGSPLQTRIPGVDFVEQLLARVADRGTRVYLLGGQPGVATLAAAKLKSKYPKLNIVGADDGGVLRPPQWDETVTAKVAAAAPAIILVALGHGKQERWIVDHLAKLPTVRIAIGVGGTLNFFAGTARRAPRLLRRLGLEWLWRLLQPNRDAYLDPWRLRRIWRATCVFSWRVVQWKWQSLWRQKY